jgi:uncharacterized phiE125 gp8 family phage protein
MTPLKLITPPAIEPLTLAETKLYLRVDHNEEDDASTRLVGAATGYADGPDGFLQRALVDQTWELTLDSFGGSSASYCASPSSMTTTGQIRIPLPPLIEIINVFYDDPGGVQQILDPCRYSIDSVNEPGWIVPVGDWPATFAGINAARIRFRAGYVDASHSPPVGVVPDDIKQALLLCARRCSTSAKFTSKGGSRRHHGPQSNCCGDDRSKHRSLENGESENVDLKCYRNGHLKARLSGDRLGKLRR